MDWNNEQIACMKDMSRFLRDPSRLFYHMRGRAGTGKTTLAQQVRDDHPDLKFIALAYTGKAASRLRDKGWGNAATYHSKLFLPSMKSRARLRAWVQELEIVGGEIGRRLPEDVKVVLTPEEHALINDLKVQQVELKKKIADEEDALKNPSWVYNQETELGGYDCVVIDEVSMIGQFDGEMLCKMANEFGVKLILMGDDNQLPPVKSTQYFMVSKPDFVLTQIMRQAKDDPILWIADYILEHRRAPPLGSYGDSRIISRLDAQECLDCDQFLLGKNATRLYYNGRMRELRGYTDIIECGEKLMCLANDKNEGYFNGTRWYVQEVFDYNSAGDRIEVRLSSDDDHEPDRDAWLHVEALKGNEVHWMDRQGAQCMVSAQALTVHKFQGSEGEHIVLLDQSYTAKQDAWRWLYTGATRAQKKLSLVNE